MANNAASAKKLQQKINRELLKLARLKTKANEERRKDARMKLRLGGFLFLLDWQDSDIKMLDSRIEVIAYRLKKADPDQIEEYRILGETTLRLLVKDRTYEPSSAGLSSDERRAQNHQKITLGGLLVKYGLHEYDRATTFGALLVFHQSE